MVGVLRKELVEKMRTKRLMGYSKDARRCGGPEGWEVAGRGSAGRLGDGWQGKQCISVCRLSG